jgi:predicted  nucleic acid-binding Zn-ribbon protein
MSNDNENTNPSTEDTLGRLVTMVQTIDSRLSNLEAKVDSRLYDTRPNLEALQSQLTEVIDSQQKFREETRDQIQGLREETRDQIQGLQEDTRDQIQGVRNDLASLRAETEKGFRTIDRRMERQIGEFERLHAYQRDLEDRVDKLEKLTSS